MPSALAWRMRSTQAGRLEQRLGRDAAAMEARAADLVLVDEGDLESQLGGPEGGRVAAGARAEHDEIEVVGRADSHGSGSLGEPAIRRPRAGGARRPDGRVGHRVRWYAWRRRAAQPSGAARRRTTSLAESADQGQLRTDILPDERGRLGGTFARITERGPQTTAVGGRSAERPGRRRSTARRRARVARSRTPAPERSRARSASPLRSGPIGRDPDDACA